MLGAALAAKLIDARSGAHLWADRYDREFKDILMLQDEVIGTIIEALAVKLTPAEAGVTLASVHSA